MTEEVLFHEALARTDPAARAAFLDAACPDPDQRRRVEALLQTHGKAVGLLDRPVPVGEPSNGTGAYAPDPADQPGARVGPYKLLQKISEGGMGVVYVAEQEQPVRRKVALKVIKPGMDSAQVIARFEAERQALAMMDHVNIAKVLDAGTTEAGRPYFVMELVKGVPITKYCDELHLTLRQRLELFVPVCQAIQHAHHKGVIHRDVKPSNVLVAMQDGRPVPKVIDFGVAKALHQPLTERTLHTEFGAVIGTLEYMPPEQAELSAMDIDTRADVYALGVLLYELLTGSTPFDRKSLRRAALTEALRIIREVEPPRPSTRITESGAALPEIAARRRTEARRLGAEVRGELDWVVMKALDKDRTRRYEAASGLARDIQRFLADEPVEACPPSAGYRLRKLARKYRGPLATAAAFAVLLVLATAVSLGLAVRAGRAEAEAVAARDAEVQQRQEAEEQRDRARQAEEEAKGQRDRALKAEGEAKDAGKRAEEERAIAQAVNNFLRSDLLGQAIREQQARAGFQPDPDIKVRTLLDRASAKVGERFKDQPRVEAQVRQTIGVAYADLSRLAEGQLRQDLQAAVEMHYTRALDLFRQVLGEDHGSTLTATFNLGAHYTNSGQHAKAEPYFLRYLEGCRRTLGVGHARTLTALNNLAFLYMQMGRSAEAEKMFREVLEECRRALGNKAPATSLLMNNLGSMYMNQERYAEAEPLLRQALEIRRQLHDNRDRNTLQSMNNLGLLYTRMGRYAEAETLLREALEGVRWLSANGSAETARALASLAGNLIKQGKYAEAESLLRECLGSREKRIPDAQETFYARSLLGESLAGQKKYAEAEPLLLAGYEGLKAREKDAGAKRITAAGERLVRLYEAWGQPDKAAEWRSKLAKAELVGPPKP